MNKANRMFVSHSINPIRKAYHFVLAPFIMIAAVIVFILDNFNVNVTPVVSYILKEAKTI